jgi:TetR/AcrR family transcriptional regulator, regulator of autoinduction and epiphytic fitness
VPRSYRSSRRETQARLTRQRVLAAATSEFLARGYAGATMRAMAAGAGVSVPTVESLFGTKARVLKAAIDVAIAGDDEPVPVLDRSWTVAAEAADTVDEVLSIVAGVIGPAQARSCGLVLAVLEGSSTDPELSALSEQMIAQRGRTAEWLVDALARRASLRDGCTRREAVDTLWVLMDPAVFDRLTRQRRWTQARYEAWFARTVRRLLFADLPAPTPTAARRRTTR